MQLGNIKRFFSPATNGKPKQSSNEHPNEVKINEIIYSEVITISMTYKVSSTQATKSKGALIDRRANGGIAGDEVRIIVKTGRSVDIQGIDKHRINENPIVTVGGIMNI